MSVFHRQYTRKLRQTGLLNTYSDHLRLSEERRQQLFAGIEEVFEQEGGRVEKPYEAVAYMA